MFGKKPFPEGGQPAQPNIQQPVAQPGVIQPFPGSQNHAPIAPAAPAPTASPVSAPAAATAPTNPFRPFPASSGAQSPASPMAATLPPQNAQPTPAPAPTPPAAASFTVKPKEEVLIYSDQKLETEAYRNAKRLVMDALLEKVNLAALSSLTREAKVERVGGTADKLFEDLSIPLNAAQIALLRKQLIDDVLGFGPLEVLLADHDVADIMINTARQVYVEKAGRLYITDITFTNEAHLLNVIQKIVTNVGRRIDESSPMVDARMPDGSRFNAIVPPIALDGALVSIRKFKKQKMDLEQYVKIGSMSQSMCNFLKICAASRLNIMISGGTGSGKTTLLNALSGNIDLGERVITIEDAAELQLHQPHVLRLETRPPNIEGVGTISQRMLVKNALRMRPDRIILGEIRGDEVIDVLQAMNTGHEGSMATIHANNPRECLSRIENLIGLAGVTLPIQALRAQVASAIHMIVQIARMRDGRRRIISISEVVGIEGDIITMQEHFHYKSSGMNEDGTLKGEFVCTKIRPRFFPQISYFGLEKQLNEALGFAS